MKGNNPRKQKKGAIENTNKQPPKNEHLLYDSTGQVKYCYCSSLSYGEMIGCENTYCEKQWFHMDCVDDRPPSSDAVWHCKDCRKLLEKFKKNINVKQFL